jgi:hypothetical protein
VTPEDAAATTTLLRAPAAIAAAAFLVGVCGATVSWVRRAPDTWAGAVLWIVSVCLVCLPFLLPTEWYRWRRRGMRLWVTAAALAASIRGIHLCVSLYPVQPLGAWLTVAGLEVAIGATLWLAVFALRWDLRRGVGAVREHRAPTT